MSTLGLAVQFADGCGISDLTSSRNFFIVGVQKGGTTALHAFLSRHPQIRMSEPKELHFFDDERRDWTAPDYADFERRFEDAGDRIRGEATPIYTYWPESLPRLQAYDPDARLIMILRHPTFRAFSHWKMETKRKADTLAFADAIGPAGRERVSNAPGGVHRVYSYVERGFYSAQVERLLALFARDQVLFVTTDDLWNAPAKVLSTVEGFLGLEARLAAAREYIIAASTEVSVALDVETRRYLDNLFARDICETARLTGLNLSEWMVPDYSEPEKST